jgi:hypothetical protein
MTDTLLPKPLAKWTTELEVGLRTPNPHAYPPREVWTMRG